MKKIFLLSFLTLFIFSCQNLPNEIVEQPAIDLSKNHELGDPNNNLNYLNAWTTIPDILDAYPEPQTADSKYYDLRWMKGGVVREIYDIVKPINDIHILMGFNNAIPPIKDGGENTHIYPEQARFGYGIEITNAQGNKFTLLYYNTTDLTDNVIGFYNFITFKNGVPQYRFSIVSGWVQYHPNSEFPWQATGQSYCYDGNTMAVSNSEGNFLRFILPSLISYGLNNTCADDLNLKPGEPFKIRALATTNPHEGSFEVLDEIIYTGKWNF